MPWFDPSWYGRRWRPAPARRWRPGGASTRAVACPVATPAVFPTPPSSCGTPADRRPTPSAPDTVLRSWEREWWSHKPSSVCAPRRASRWSSLWDGRHRPPQAAYPQVERPGPGLAAYLALLRLGVAVPRLLPDARWALTPPFHPYPLDKRAVCSLWPCPSPGGAQALPGSLPCGARTFLDAPLQPARRDHRTLPPPRGKATDVGRAGASLPRQAPYQPGQAVRRQAHRGPTARAGGGTGIPPVQPEPVVLLEDGASQAAPIACAHERGRELHGVHGVDPPRPVQREELVRPDVPAEQEDGPVREREPAQQAEREPVGGRPPQTEREQQIGPQSQCAVAQRRRPSGDRVLEGPVVCGEEALLAERAIALLRRERVERAVAPETGEGAVPRRVTEFSGRLEERRV